MPTQVTLAPPLTDGDRTTIRDIIAKFDRDMLASDWTAAVSVYTEDAVLMPPNAPMLRGRTEIRKFFEAYPKIREFKQTPLEIAGEGDVAFPWGTYDLVTAPDGVTAIKDKGKVLAVWHKQPDGKWLVTRVCWNSDLPPVTPPPAART
jgi:uncharacterized protein (TIGR02246 family)